MWVQALGADLGVIAVFVVILFVLQRADLEKVAGGDAKAVQRAVAEGGGKIENPTTMEEPRLWAAFAVKPINNEAIEARGQMWDAGRRSQKLAWIVMLLIGGPLIAIAAVYGSIRALASVRIGSGETSPHSEIKIGVATPEFKAKSRDGKVRPGEDVPAPFAAALKAMPNSARWKKLTVEGGSEGIVVTRKGGLQADWLCDLWLAERLAEAA